MSSYDQGPHRPGIPLTHTSDSKSYRLLELPPDLQAQLESQSPPLLHLESGTPHAVLVSPTHRYILTQRNTSNSLILLTPEETTPTPTPAPSDSSASPSARTAEPGLSIIGTVHEKIELAPEPPRPERSLGAMKFTGGGGKWDEKYGDGK